jgi:hypothetical protein
MKMKTRPTGTYGTSKGSLQRTHVAMRVYIKRSERSQINDLILHLKLLEKQDKQIWKQAEGEK